MIADQARHPRMRSFLLLLCLPIASVQAQQMSKEEQAIYDQMVKSAGVDPALVAKARTDNDQARRWSEGKGGLVHYHIVGTFKGAPDVIGDANWIGYADVVDRVEIDLDWKLDEARMVGAPRFLNSKSVVRNVRNSEPKCLPPVLNGDYEHLELTGIKQGLGGVLQMQVQTSYPKARVTQFCTGSGKDIPASLNRHAEELPILSPVLFGTAGASKGQVRVSADGKSLVTSRGGWTWTYTPSVAR